MGYDHTQKSPLGAIVLLSGVFCAVIAYFVLPDVTTFVILDIVVAILVFISFCFGTLRVRDERTHLGVRFGPLPIFHTRLAYTKMTAVEPARSTFIDGLGIHWIPGRGLIYNLWGFDCVKVEMGKWSIRIGTDDVEVLVKFLRSKIESS